MAHKAKWKGNLTLSQLSCPVFLYPATKKGPRSRVLFNRKTGNLVIRKRVDVATEKSIKTKYIFEDAKTGRALGKDDLAEITVTIEGDKIKSIDNAKPGKTLDIETVCVACTLQSCASRFPAVRRSFGHAKGTSLSANIIAVVLWSLAFRTAAAR